MPAATDEQMQVFANERVRPFAEAFRKVLILARDHQSAFDDIYARAISNSRWTDNRTDVPHILQSGNSASPDDMLNFNTFVFSLLRIIDAANGTNDAEDAANVRNNWKVLVDACVRPPQIVD